MPLCRLMHGGFHFTELKRLGQWRPEAAGRQAPGSMELLLDDLFAGLSFSVFRRTFTVNRNLSGF
jgi:hypothetical protein